MEDGEEVEALAVKSQFLIGTVLLKEDERMLDYEYLFSSQFLIGTVLRDRCKIYYNYRR